MSARCERPRSLGAKNWMVSCQHVLELSPVFEIGSLCSVEAPYNPTASVFPSVEGETSRSFWLLSNYP